MSTYRQFAAVRPAMVVGALGLLFAGSSGAYAQTLEGNLLLRQSVESNGWVNQVFTDFPTFSTGMGSMITTTEQWWISDIQVHQIAGGSPNTWFGNVNTAVLNVSRQVGGLPDPAIVPTSNLNSGPSVVYSGDVIVVLDRPTNENKNFRMVVNTTGIAELQGLAPGDYVFSLTGIASNADFGQTFTTGAGVGPAPDYVRNIGAGFGVGSDWTPLSTLGADVNTQWAIGINGAVPEPGAMMALATGLGAFLLRRRRPSA